MRSFGDLVFDMNPASSGDAAWSTFEPAIRRWIEMTSAAVVLEVGGGRTPMLSEDECRDLGIDRYLVNDVSQQELDHLPPTRERACFDIQHGPPADADYGGSCDLVFAHMVSEHVSDPKAAWQTMYRLLRPGGIAVSFHPVLFSPPFVANWLLPERLTKPVLTLAFSRRNDDDHPKFPARYRWCRASMPYMAARLEPIGFSSVDVLPFYGHGYFKSIPVLRGLDRRISDLALRKRWTALASYAFVIATR